MLTRFRLILLLYVDYCFYAKVMFCHYLLLDFLGDVVCWVLHISIEGTGRYDGQVRNLPEFSE